jgi:hypothetical protein
MKKNTIIFLICILLGSINLQPEDLSLSATGEIRTSTGRVSNMTLTYTENRSIIIKKVKYYNQKNRLILEAIEKYTPEPLELQEMWMLDHPLGRKASFKNKGSYYAISYKHNRNKDEKQKVVQKQYKNLLYGTMIITYITQNIKKLVAGEKVSFNLLVPSHFRAISFFLKKEKETSIGNQKCMVVIMRPTSIIIRQFVGACRYYMSLDPPHYILRYDGILTPSDSEGNRQKGIVLLNQYQENNNM